MVSTFAGSGNGAWGDGVGAAAKFKSPYGVALDSLGTLFVADFANNRIRKSTSAGESCNVDVLVSM